jgi:O-antigen/teichoic acid export membrane protein
MPTPGKANSCALPWADQTVDSFVMSQATATVAPSRSPSRRGALAYVSVTAIQRCATFVTLPVFAAAVTPTEYGRITVLVTVYGLATVLLSGGLEIAVFRGVFDHEDPGRQLRYLRTLATTLFIGPLVIGVIAGALLAAGPPVLGVEPVSLGVYVATAGVITAATVTPLALLRARERFHSYALLSLACVATQLGLRILLVVVADRGVAGWVLADLLAAMVALLLSLAWQGPLLTLRRGSGADLRSGLGIGLPLVPHLAAHWGLNFSDRLILAAFYSTALVGTYGMGYQIAFVGGMAVTELNRAYMPRYGEAVNDRLLCASLSIRAREQSLATIAITATVSLLGPQVVYLTLPTAYHSAVLFIPWVSLGFALLGFYYLPMNVISIVAGKTSGIGLSTIIASAVNVGANLMLVPRFGPIAAAVDTALGFLVLLILVAMVARRRCPTVKLDLRPIRGAVLISGALAAAGSAMAVRPGSAGLAGALGCLTLVGLVLGTAARRPAVCNIGPSRLETRRTCTK